MQLARDLFPKEIEKVSAAPVSGILSTLNAQYELNPANAAETQALSLLKQRFLWGAPVLNKIIESLKQASPFSPSFRLLLLFLLWFKLHRADPQQIPRLGFTTMS